MRSVAAEIIDDLAAMRTRRRNRRTTRPYPAASRDPQLRMAHPISLPLQTLRRGGRVPTRCFAFPEHAPLMTVGAHRCTARPASWPRCARGSSKRAFDDAHLLSDRKASHLCVFVYPAARPAEIRYSVKPLADGFRTPVSWFAFQGRARAKRTSRFPFRTILRWLFALIDRTGNSSSIAVRIANRQSRGRERGGVRAVARDTGAVDWEARSPLAGRTGLLVDGGSVSERYNFASDHRCN